MSLTLTRWLPTAVARRGLHLSAAPRRSMSTHFSRFIHTSSPHFAGPLPLRHDSSIRQLRPHTPPLPTPDKSYTLSELKQLLATVNQSPTLPSRSLPIVSIGAGNIVQVAHYPAYRQAGFEVAAVTDRSRQTAEATAKLWQPKPPKVYDTAAELINAYRDQAVVYDIAVPALAILDIIQQLPDGAYALIQKPMGESIEDARAIREVCRAKRLRGAVNFQLRYAPNILAAKSLITAGVIGAITAIDFRINVHTPWSKWTFMEQASRMEVIYHSIHYIDLIRDLYGEPQQLHAMTWKHPDSTKLHSVRSNLLLLYDPAVQTTIHTNHFHRFGRHKHVESYLYIEGRRGALKAQLGENIEYPRSDLDYLHVATEATADDWLDVKLRGSRFVEAFVGPMADLQRWAVGDTDGHPTSVDDAYRTMAVCEAAYESAEKLSTIKYD